jgi:hypothetical protein
MASSRNAAPENSAKPLESTDLANFFSCRHDDSARSGETLQTSAVNKDADLVPKFD